MYSHPVKCDYTKLEKKYRLKRKDNIRDFIVQIEFPKVSRIKLCIIVLKQAVKFCCMYIISE